MRKMSCRRHTCEPSVFDGFHGNDGKAWLLAVVRNTCHAWVRQQKGNVPKVVFDEQMHGGEHSGTVEANLVEKSKLGSLHESSTCCPSIIVEFW